MPLQATPQLITSQAALEALAQTAARAPWLAMDTEFMREKTYFPDLCLLQFGQPGRVDLVDTRADLDLSVLGPPLCDPAIIKLMHAPRQDLEVLAPIFSARIAPLIDTQLAAALTGASPQAAYSSLVRDELQIDLGKSHARTDWARRPLSAEQLSYAADDVRYLDAVWACLQPRLQAAGRLDWFAQEMKVMANQALFVEPTEAWRRIKGLNRLTARQRAGLAALAQWREERAIARNRPRSWIVPDRTLLEIVCAWPRNRSDLAALASLDAALVNHCGDDILRTLDFASAQTAPAWDAREPDRAELKRLGMRLRAIAEHLAIDPTVLATKADLQALALGQAGCRLLAGWRREAVGSALLNELAALRAA